MRNFILHVWAPKGPATYKRLGVKDTKCRDKEDRLVITALVLTIGLGQYGTLRTAWGRKMPLSSCGHSILAVGVS